VADETKKCDAILCPRDYPTNVKGVRKSIKRNEEFGPLLGVPRVHSSQQPGGMDFLRADPSHTEFHGDDDIHTKGDPRYAWKDRGDGVQLGTLIPDEAEPEPFGPGQPTGHPETEADAEPKPHA